MTDDPRRLRDAFGTFLTGVTVVTTTRDGQPLGFTANSFSSVSLDPPLLLVSIANASHNRAAFAEGAGFAINILAETQKDVSATFARPVEDRFATVSWRNGPAGNPILDGTAAWFDCTLHQVIPAGDHTILIGRIEAFEATPRPGLGYHRGSYFTPALAGAAAASGPAVVIRAVILRDGKVLLIDDGRGGLTLPTTRAGSAGATAALTRLIADTGLQASPGMIYAVYEDVAAAQQHIAFLCPCTGGTPTQGALVDLDPAQLHDITDPALRVMLDRLAEETRIGNYGIYFGNENAGQVAQVAQGKTP